MPETGYNETYDQEGHVFASEEFTISDDALLVRELEADCNSHHTAGLLAYKNWGSLTLAQKDAVLKELLGAVLAITHNLGYYRLT